MDTDSSKHCPSCGTLLDQGGDSLASGLCPRCLLESSLYSTIAGQPAFSKSPDLEEVAAAFSDLEIIELIGRGGMGAVYKARQKSLDRMVALKLLPAALGADLEFAKRFEAEAKALAALNHPNIVTVHEFGQRGDFYFLLMEYVDGPNLRNLLRDHRLAPDEALTIIPPLCEALEYAHKRNVVHCDIKPENLLLNTEGQVKIADFGIARILGQSAEDSEKLAGTPAYMAPEQRDSPASVDTRADIYSLGVVFYEMLTGERPNGTLIPPSGKNTALDVRLDQIVLRALDANPNLRWQSANALNSELQTLLTERLGEPKVSPPEKLPNSSPKFAWLSCMLAVTAVIVLIGAHLGRGYIEPVAEAEHQEAINGWFEHKVKLADLQIRRAQLEEKANKTPADIREMQELWDQMTEHDETLDLFGELRGVTEPLIERDVFSLLLVVLALIGGIAAFLGVRHLSWLRGQGEPLPALRAAIVGALLCPLLLIAGIVLPAVIQYRSLLANTLAISAILLLSLWAVLRALAWAKNLRRAPAIGIKHLIIIALIGLSVAAPYTAAKQRYINAVREQASQTIELERTHQEYFGSMSRDSGESQAEKLEKAKRGCEEYAQQKQKLALLSERSIRLSVPKTGDLIQCLVLSIIALVVAFVVSVKFRKRRS